MADEQLYLKYVLEGVHFQEALVKAKKENKYLWVVIGDTRDTKHSTYFLNKLSRKGVFKKYGTDFVFYACNITENEQYYYILRPQTIPNSYIFDNNGRLISSYENSKDIEKFTVRQLGCFQIDKSSYSQHSNTDSLGDNRFILLNTLIEASNILYHSDSMDYLLKAKNILDRIDDFSLNYFAAYLKTQLSLKLKDSVSASKYADIAYEQYNADTNPLYYSILNDRIKNYSGKYKADVANKPLLSFDRQKIDCGEMKRGKDFTITVNIKNEGSSPLVIFQTVVSCKCLIVDFPKREILPKESVGCRFVYDTREKGKFSRTVYFESNASNRFEKITLEGQII